MRINMGHVKDRLRVIDVYSIYYNVVNRTLINYIEQLKKFLLKIISI